MSLALGIGLGLPFRGEPFNPASLFAASEPGFWADVRPAVLWQDTGRTTPVTADGDPVASWALNTASGVIYATQSTAGNRPVYKVDAGGRGYLEFDGETNNRWLVTPTITPGADKVQVFAGVRKLTTATGNIVESSVNAGTNTGAFYLFSSATNGQTRYNFLSQGTSLAGSLVNHAAVPVTSVVTGIGDISAPLSTMRLDGVDGTPVTTTQGTGNYLAYPLYIGRRGGASLPFNGRIYGLIVRFGGSLSKPQIVAAENWMNARTGAY